MAHLDQHLQDCVHWLGKPHEDVNRWLDEFMPVAGASHRRFRHHREGVAEAERLFGKEGAKAAMVHILRDCRNIPRQIDYETGAADALGLKSEWPTSAYIHYTEEAFNTLVKYMLQGPTGLMLWSFLDGQQDVENLLKGVTKLSPHEVQETLLRWPSGVQYRQQLAPMEFSSPALEAIPSAVAQYLNETSEKARVRDFEQALGSIEFAVVRIQDLITPLLVIDYEYVEQLKADLQGIEPLDLAKFALPERLNVNMQAMQDPSGRSVTFVSAQKNLAILPMTLNEIPGVGIEVRVLIAGTPQLVIVSEVAGRLVLRNGVHRAFLLASMGVKAFPCMLVHEKRFPVVSGLYPTFAPQMLALPRPPLLMDFFDEQLTLHAPFRRTSKLIRISGEDIVIPTE